MLRLRLRMQAMVGSTGIGTLIGFAAAHCTSDLLKRHFDAVGAGTIGTLLVFALVGVVTLVLILVRRTFGPPWTAISSIPLGALVGAFALTLFVGLIS
jgi:uncharacterized membrane protein (Fun14 family)